MSDQDLDTRIRTLVAEAVADAPTAPDLEDAVLRPHTPRPDHRRWWVGGGAAALAAAAALITAVVLVDDTDDRISTPLDTTPVSTALAPVVPAPTVATTVPLPSTAVAPPIDDKPAIVVANADGVTVIGDPMDVARTIRTLPTPATIGLLTPGGDVIFQPTPDLADDSAGDPQIWRLDGTVQSLLAPPGPSQSYRLHDIATIGGVPTVLYGLRTGGDGIAPGDHREQLLALGLVPDGAWTTTPVAEINTWEGGYGRLSLSDGGTIVGVAGQSVTSAFFTEVVPGSPDDGSPPIDPTSLGLQPSYVDCERCPDEYAISPDGTLVAWVEEQELVVSDLTAGTSSATHLDVLAAPFLTSLDVQRGRDGAVDALISLPPDEGVPPGPQFVVVALGGGTNDVSTSTFDQGLATLWPPATIDGAEPLTPPAAPEPPVTTEMQQHIATAGPDGVVLRDLSGTVLRRLDGPALQALPVGDGRVVVELGEPDGVSFVAVWDTDDSLEYPFPGAGRDVDVADVAIVDGRPVLLYALTLNLDLEPESHLYAAPITTTGIDLSAPIELGLVGGPEFGVTGLHLAANGLVVGESWSESVSKLYVNALPGTAGAAMVDDLQPAQLGLDAEYDRATCQGCFARFAVDGDGDRMAWTHRTDLVLVDLPYEGAETEQRINTGVIDEIVDVDVNDSGIVIGYGAFDGRPPVWLANDGTTTRLEGHTAHIGPGVATGSISGSVSTSATSNLLVTAGPDGVAVLDDGAEVRRLIEEAGVAYGTPGGAVVFQTSRAWSDGIPVSPLIWRADETVERLLTELPVGQSYRLYDVANVAGVPTVLYGVRTRPADGNPAGHTEALFAVTMAGDWPTVQLAEMDTWEAGYSHLSLSDDGLVVGDVSESVSRSLFSVVIPGSPAEARGPLAAADLGVEPTYADCDCPQDFTIAADGTTVAWTSGTRLFVRLLAENAVNSWDVPTLADLPVRGLDVRRTGEATYDVVVNAGRLGEEQSPEAVVLTLGDDGTVTEAPAGGRFASFGP